MAQIIQHSTCQQISAGFYDNNNNNAAAREAGAAAELAASRKRNIGTSMADTSLNLQPSRPWAFTTSQTVSS